MAVAGWLLALWSVVGQFDLGRGTPVPLMATQRLVVEPPYTYTRNPMVLGALGLYMGIAVMRRSLSAIGLVLACGAALLVYVRRAEEKEMLARFGQEYVAYRARTRFCCREGGAEDFLADFWQVTGSNRQRRHDF